MTGRRSLLRAARVLALAGGLVGSGSAALAASEIAVIVNKDPITTFAIQQRMAFVKLRKMPGDPRQVATDELIDEALKNQEIRRVNVRIPDQMVDQAFQKFAGDNKLTTDQLGEVLSHNGFSTRAFKDYIRVQMGWGQAVQASLRKEAGAKMSEEDAVRRMLSQGGSKPSTTEYLLQQVIFVVPAEKRAAIMNQRMTEANGMRNRFSGCEGNYAIAAGLRDVTVRDLGRVAQPELPGAWTDAITKIKGTGTTPPLQTDRGVEFIAVCSSRSISDDRTAAMVFQSEDLQKSVKDGPDTKLLKKLKDKAAIIRR